MYKTVLIDVFNILHRLKTEETDVIELTNNFIDYVDLKIKPYLEEESDIHLLFDPIVKSDMGLTKCFKVTTDRQSIVDTYKSNRKFSSLVSASAKLTRQYYQFRGEHIKSYVSEFLEADDYVESILKNYSEHDNIALYTTDLDWAKYITSNIVIINKLSNQIYGIKEYEEKHGYVPTIASVSLEKAFFGDKSDNIIGAVNVKPNKAIKSIHEDIHNYIKYIASTKDTLKEVVTRLKAYKFAELSKKDEKTIEEKLWTSLNSGNTRISIMSTLINNLRVIKSRCKDANKYMTCYPENKKINGILEASLGKGENSQVKFKFGNAK